VLDDASHELVLAVKAVHAACRCGWPLMLGKASLSYRSYQSPAPCLVQVTWIFTGESSKTRLPAHQTLVQMQDLSQVA